MLRFMVLVTPVKNDENGSIPIQNTTKKCMFFRFLSPSCIYSIKFLSLCISKFKKLQDGELQAWEINVVERGSSLKKRKRFPLALTKQMVKLQWVLTCILCVQKLKAQTILVIPANKCFEFIQEVVTSQNAKTSSTLEKLIFFTLRSDNQVFQKSETRSPKPEIFRSDRHPESSFPGGHNNAASHSIQS